MGVAVKDVRFGVARGAGLEGHYAGIVTRFAAFVIDVVTIFALFTLGGHLVEYIFTVLLRDSVRLEEAPIVSRVALAIWVFIYFAYPLAASGRTFGMAAMGVRAVRADGGDLNAWHAVVRVLALPFSFLLLGFGFLLIVLRRDRRALHDLIAGSAVVYAWDARAARLRFLARR
jgi:uncharacterized RDD family membrane protein YckC